MARISALHLLVGLALAFCSCQFVQCKISYPWVRGVAHATFYGGEDAGDSEGGACGYGNAYLEAGIETADLSPALFGDGETCGACYQLRCAGEMCNPGSPGIMVTATNICPEGSYGGWCNAPKVHFDLSEPAFTRLASYETEAVPVDYRRVRCVKEGGIRFKIDGKPFFNLFLVHNVGGVGDVKEVYLRVGSSHSWKPLKRNWGQNWENTDDLKGKALSFKVVTSDDRFCVSPNVIPAGWDFGQTYEGRQFR